MSYYNSLRLTSDDSIELIGKRKSLSHLKINRVQSGLDYKNWPIILPGASDDFEIKSWHWEYIPSIVQDEHDLFEARIMNHWLTIKAENLLKNDRGNASLFREGALHGRCLVLSSGFYDYKAVPKIGKKGQPLKQTERIPYFITLQNDPSCFFMAGISRMWTNHTRQQSAGTFGIVTTQANELMQDISNIKLRMPVILPQEEAIRWLLGNLNEDEIMQIGSYQFPSEKMKAWRVEKII